MSIEVPPVSTGDTLEPRRLPTQNRSRKTVENILDAAAELLEEIGLKSFTTRHVATRTGISVSTLYHYFPNKHALLLALGKRIAKQQEALVSAVLMEHPPANWVEATEQTIDAVVQGRKTFTGAIAIRQAMQTHAELRDIDLAQDRRHAEMAVQRMISKGVQLPEERLRRIALVSVQIVTELLDSAILREPDSLDAVTREIKIVVRQYFSYYEKDFESNVEGMS